METSAFKWPIVTFCALFTYVAIFLLRDSALLTLIAVMLLGTIMLRVSWSWEHLIVYGVLFVVAIGTEILFVSIGVWSYGVETVFGIPLWIPFMWSNSGLFVIELKEAVDKYLQA